MSKLTQKLAPYLLSLLRIVLGLQFTEHGSQKFLNFPPAPQAMHLPLFSLAWFSGFLELFGGLFILFGLFTQPVAFILSGEMAVAYFMVHAPRGFFPIATGGNGGDLAVTWCFLFLFFAAAGGGPWSLDRLWRK